MGGVDERQLPGSALDLPGYRFVKELGSGGQGQVWEAIRLEDNRKVAVKFIRPDRVTDPHAKARFDQESYALSLIEHPGIVKVLAHGDLPSGELWHATEYIAGRPLTEYIHDLEKKALAGDVPRGSASFPLRPALGLFVKVCDAVQAAHRVGVIHRDLKPSNILVDDTGRPHVVDFGAAKAPEVRSPDAVTVTGEFLGSLAWSSPEQIEGQPAHIDVRTDVYTLGIILYRVLTGTFPYDVTQSDIKVADAIRYAEPVPPRAQVTWIEDDLEAVMLKAIAKERNERYQSVGQLQDDVERYIRGEPVSAKGDSWWYLTKKRLRRYRVAVASVTVILLLTIAFAVALTGAYRKQSATEAAMAQQMQTTTFLLSEFLEVYQPGGAAAGVAVQDLLDETLERIHGMPEGQEAVQSNLLDTVATAYYKHGFYQKSANVFAAALELRRNELGAQHDRTYSSMSNLGLAQMQLREYVAAEENLSTALAGFRKVLGDEHIETVRGANNLATFYIGTRP